MKRITCYVRPHRVEMVKSAIAAAEVNGMTVSDVRGVGVSPVREQRYSNLVGVVPMPIQAKIEVVVADAQVEEIVESILRNARTGEADDGKIFIEDVADAYRIRTHERGEIAV
ncbi:GlnK Nitrogen regulatory protein PII [Fimbriimonadaceae bacterium]|jgi:nitrogen regulatory protein PII